MNIQDYKEFASNTLNRDCWSKESVARLIRGHFKFWQVDRESPEAAMYIQVCVIFCYDNNNEQYYNPSSFPHIAVLDPLTGEKMTTISGESDVSTIEKSRLYFQHFLR